MKREWNADELAEYWSLRPEEKALLGNKTGATRLGFAVLLKFFQHECRFPKHRHEVPLPVVKYVARYVAVPQVAWSEYDLESRAAKYHRAQIREFLGFREATVEDAESLSDWMVEHVLAKDQNPDHIASEIANRCRVLHIEPPAPERFDRLIRSALSTFEKQFCDATTQRLSPQTCESLDALLSPDMAGDEDTASSPEQARAALTGLLADPGGATLENLLDMTQRLDRLRSLEIPDDLFQSLSPRIVQSYRQRVAVESPYELRRHATPLRMTFLAAFGLLRKSELTDSLIDLLLSTVHRIASKAERRVQKEWVNDLKRVTGKNSLLFQVAEASLSQPEGVVKDVVYPVVGEEILRDLVTEWQATGKSYRNQVQTIICNSYRSYYRRMLPRLMDALEFRSNNDRHRPVLQAIEILKKYADSKATTYPLHEIIPLDGVVRPQWQHTVCERDDAGRQRINRVSYEICVLQALRTQLRCKEIWTVGANRYRNPDDDLPADFDAQRAEYYEALKMPGNADEYIARLQQEMENGLTSLDRSMPQNPYVKIVSFKKGGRFKLTPLEPQSEPANIFALKGELATRWSMIGLLDMFKETALRTGFIGAFHSATAWENLDQETLQHRLLLCIYGIGTNAGIKRMSAGDPNVTYKDLLYVKRRFLNKDQLRYAISQVVNATLRARNPQIWGEGTTACASDSKKFGAWDQNLITEWHIRYGGRGVMIYWHVERKSLCIYSQLKTCSSSEAAAMIEGVMRHCTEMSVDRQYVDSHGQTEVAFAFCRLLGFELLPRLKAIAKQKLYRPETGKPDAYPNLTSILTRAINWELIRQQYDQMIKYATALRLGTAETEAILRRFTRNNVQHPTYKALAELGKALKTIFLCRYLQFIELRREIHEGLNVVENWNSANGFIFFGKGSEMTSNRQKDLELSMLALHLLQICMVYINTLMIQQVLAERRWAKRLTKEDLRALTPLIYGHINPYGLFLLDMRARLPIESAYRTAA
jgi:TnpA family transposase